MCVEARPIASTCVIVTSIHILQFVGNNNVCPVCECGCVCVCVCVCVWVSVHVRVLQARVRTFALKHFDCQIDQSFDEHLHRA
jgi:hypothetical protein